MENESKQSYAMFLQDPRWKRKAYYIKKRDGNKCALCESTNNLQVHHIKYGQTAEPWNVKNEQLITLCEECHQAIHSGKIKLSYPQMGKFYSFKERVILVCKIDQDTNNVICLSFDTDTYEMVLSKFKFAAFCELWQPCILEKFIANEICCSLVVHTKNMENMKYLIRYQKNGLCLSEEIITFPELSYVRKVLISFLEENIFSVTKPQLYACYNYYHSDYWNECLCIQANDGIIMLEWDCGGSGLYIGFYNESSFYHHHFTQCKISECNQLWIEIYNFLSDPCHDHTIIGMRYKNLDPIEMYMILDKIEDCRKAVPEIDEQITKLENYGG